jgi:methyl-accepting chemotaxis protein
MPGNTAAHTLPGRLSFFGIDEDSYRSFPAIAKAVERHAPQALANFYTKVRSTPEATRYFSSSQQMDHARDKQLEHWRQLFARPLDSSYQQRAEKIGHVHARIGLSPTWYIGGYARVLDEMVGKLMAGSVGARLSGKALARTIGTLIKSAMLDMDVALATYFAAEEEKRAAVIEKVGAVLGRLAQGDFTATLDDLPSGYEKLVEDFGAMRDQMRATLQQVAETAQTIATGSAEISSASDDLSRRTEHQASALEETSATMSQVADTVRETAKGASTVSRSVSEAHNDASEGTRVVQEAVTAMSDIEKSAQEIAQIISVIDSIAFQTNLLALNAGVEAARAGDAGKGFAVVANEVRALAQRSADAAKDIKGLIESSSRQVTAGVALVGRTGEALERILNRVAEISGQATEISASAEAQAAAMAQVNTAVADMDKTTQQNAAMVEESTAAAKSLAAQADELTSLVSRFRLGEAAGRAASRRQAAPAPKAVQPKLRTIGNAALKGDDDWSDF